MTDVLGPTGPITDDGWPDDGPPPGADDAGSGERITEIGPPESVDRAEHPVATALGVGALLLVVLIGLLALSGLMTTDEQQGRQVAEIVVPRVSGRTLPAAQAQLEQLGLIVDVRYEPNEVAPVDVVVDQEPIAGARLEVGEQVVLVVSDGPAGVRVPDFGEVTGAEAVRLLGALGLVGVVEEVYDEDVPQGAIVGAIPAVGARAVPGEQVTVLVSKGPEPRTVPEVVGQPSTEAFVALGRAELEIGRVTRRESAGAEPGTVLSTTPAGGAQAPRGYPVEVVVVAEPGSSDVPDLVGFAQASATRIASELGLKVSVRTEVVTAGDRRAGRVISQSPVANSPIGAGGTITITVGAVPAPTTTTTSTTTPARGATTTTAPRR
jgi:beta-lactam-binding protein with PASTA domain